MEIDAKVVKDLREKTGAGVMDCKKALAECGGNLEKASLWLREKGIASAAKRSSRVASEGAVGSYVHAGGKLGVLVEVNCETDFAAKGPDFQTLVKEIAMQIAATNPRCVRREELAPEIIEQERQIYAQQSAGKPANVIGRRKKTNNKAKGGYCYQYLILLLCMCVWRIYVCSPLWVDLSCVPSMDTSFGVDQDSEVS